MYVNFYVNTARQINRTPSSLGVYTALLLLFNLQLSPQKWLCLPNLNNFPRTVYRLPTLDARDRDQKISSHIRNLSIRSSRMTVNYRIGSRKMSQMKRPSVSQEQLNICIFLRCDQKSGYLNKSNVKFMRVERKTVPRQIQNFKFFQF